MENICIKHHKNKNLETLLLHSRRSNVNFIPGSTKHGMLLDCIATETLRHTLKTLCSNVNCYSNQISLSNIYGFSIQVVCLWWCSGATTECECTWACMSTTVHKASIINCWLAIYKHSDVKLWCLETRCETNPCRMLMPPPVPVAQPSLYISRQSLGMRTRGWSWKRGKLIVSPSLINV